MTANISFHDSFERELANSFVQFATLCYLELIFVLYNRDWNKIDSNIWLIRSLNY